MSRQWDGCKACIASRALFARDRLGIAQQHGQGSRQASSNGMKELYHSYNVTPNGYHGMEKLYSHEKCESI